MRYIIKIMTVVACICMLTTSMVFAASASTRIKDIAKVQGVRSNQLVGYGLVVGLQGTGDSNKMTQTMQSIGNMMQAFGVSIDTSSLKPKNVAAVIVTATLPPFVREGDNIDITVSSIGDATSIQGGTLIQTPLKAANGNVYAVAQGAVSTGGFVAGRGGNGTAQKNFPTVGTTPNGAIVEKTVEDDLASISNNLSLSLSKADFTTASRIAEAINRQYGSIAKAANPGRVDVIVPAYYRNDVVGFVASLEDIYVTPDNVAKVVVNERTGTIVMGGNVSVDSVAITQGGLSIKISKETEVDQPAPYSLGHTVVTQSEDTEVEEAKANSIVLPATANVNDIVGALNSVGATPRDIISILQAIKASGALHAELEII
ncbi:MAG: flagellar basal body P-ring protein FlgI [Anaerovibrio sp.]|uniref:flagellar basal body P-ring protein FlgI n=1 Tax=Anaerovibrio sp. TaxID=1872532 RepID=UPI0025F39F09|nr:flagellar basal body P-ring protein FlgI [Anaerovibrio sp.]MCR5176208.1 flagellar basal body P-ring protein FlgI [Anaerovibrio sp.]